MAAQVKFMYYQLSDDASGKPRQSKKTATSVVAQLFAGGSITLQTKVWAQGMSGWAPLSKVKARFVGLENIGEISEAAKAPEPEPVVIITDHAGFLEKKAGFSAKWKTCYAEVDGANLVLKPTAASETASESFPLELVSTTQKSMMPGATAEQFEVVTVSATHQFKCASAEEAELFIQTFSRATTRVMSASLVRVFKEADVDNSGFLDSDELHRAIREILDHDVSGAEFDALVKQVDLNGDGKIDYAEAAPLLYALLKESGTHMGEEKATTTKDHDHQALVAHAKIRDLEQELANAQLKTKAMETELGYRDVRIEELRAAPSASSSRGGNATASPIGVYKVGAHPVVMRAGASTSSEQVGELAAGSEVAVLERSGARRLRTAGGWVSEKTAGGQALLSAVWATYSLC